MGPHSKKGQYMGEFIVIIGPTASGKTLLITELLKRLPNAARLVTTTTRARRTGEQDGREYVFASREEFNRGICDGEFIEWAEVHGNLYGSSRKVLDSFRKQFTTVLAAIDVQGSRILKESDPSIRTLFIRPGSLTELERRLRVERPDANDDEIRTRLETAQKELSLADTFDLIIENIDGQFEFTIAQALAYVEECAKARA